jgi:hypothetical protein
VFLSFQISHVTSKVSEATVLLVGDGAPFMWSHHSLRDCNCRYCWFIEVIPSHSLLSVYILTVNRQHTKRCAAHTVVLLHKGKMPQFGHPLFSNPSAVNNLIFRATQVRNFVFGGAQTLQTIVLCWQRLHQEIAPYMPKSRSICHWS